MREAGIDSNSAEGPHGHLLFLFVAKEKERPWARIDSKHIFPLGSKKTPIKKTLGLRLTSSFFNRIRVFLLRAQRKKRSGFYFLCDTADTTGEFIDIIS